ncbi:transcription factor DIVARICATA-like isoform X1 [Arachis duranensis]|uniref:Transcription factor DIVARICATA-like isoform X1 n=1 Tax=Arachis duranensis TaxID=130453 RepID=A0A6P5MN15_ARADU|nr:transcription factor DIVARICATA-like isoform X1 [Arachis duranensis]XP_052110525.1 transcription factor DIVARICATA-like isoform X1 [Arachis duranensis]XP_052110526.1 transcription factor DIVARICATA-like isoform X1 [Arachis duranensis]XP_052110527.1 transcription factor DIVARICATA-like isoform X1 [Arachis duranensis]XP_052110528.1 transcription factor DIVARICATA-like isoform X1 [Arachis duranensis]XP_052110529.1 transcription factor DIVARICATA-like isoform X1 [Arachis duranensis]
MSEEELGTFSMMDPLDMIDPWDMIDWDADRRNMVEQCAIDVGGNQPPQPKPQPDVREITVAQFFSDTCGNPQFDMVLAECLPEPQPQPQPQPQSHPHPQQFQQFLADCGYQLPESQLQLQPMQPQVWTWEENKAFESVITNCFEYAKRNSWELIAARLPGKTPAQLQERFKKLMKDINVIHNGYTSNTPLNTASENMTMIMAAPITTLEHNPVSVPIINATTTTPPPPPYNTDHQHHRAEVVAAAAPMEAATREQSQSANTNNTKKYSRWTEDEHRLFVRGYQAEGTNWSRISEYYVKTRTYHQISSHAQKYFRHKERLAKGEKLRKSIYDVI